MLEFAEEWIDLSGMVPLGLRLWLSPSSSRVASFGLPILILEVVIQSVEVLLLRDLVHGHIQMGLALQQIGSTEEVVHLGQRNPLPLGHVSPSHPIPVHIVSQSCPRRDRGSQVKVVGVQRWI